jgi:site-specific recombinase XerD
MTLNEWKLRYLEYIEIEKGRSLKTSINYDRYLSRFLDYLKNKNLTKVSDLSENIIREYRLWLNRQLARPEVSKKNPIANETLKKKTQNYYLIALRSFIKYLNN